MAFDNLIAHTDIAGFHVVLHVLLHRGPVKTTREKLGGSIPTKMPGIRGIMMFCNKSSAEVVVFGDKQAKSFVKHKVVFQSEFIC